MATIHETFEESVPATLNSLVPQREREREREHQMIYSSCKALETCPCVVTTMLQSLYRVLAAGHARLSLISASHSDKTSEILTLGFVSSASHGEALP